MADTLTRVEGDRAYEYKDGVWYLIEEEDQVAQGDWHAVLARALWEMLEELLRPHPLARVFFDIFIHWDKTKSDRCLAPDLVVFPRIERRNCKAMYLWDEASMPVFVLEVLSDKTRSRDLNLKLRAYQDEMRVPEYFMCDPTDGEQQVCGFRLVDWKYQPIEPDERGRVWSEELRAWFGPDELGDMQIWDASGRRMARHEEALDEREAERLRADAERLRAEAALEQAASAARERDAERGRAEAAETRAREMEAALRRLRDARNDEPAA